MQLKFFLSFGRGVGLVGWLVGWGIWGGVVGRPCEGGHTTGGGVSPEKNNGDPTSSP